MAVARAGPDTATVPAGHFDTWRVEMVTPDVAVVPSPGNSLCPSALVVTEAEGESRTTSATVAPIAELGVAAE